MNRYIATLVILLTAIAVLGVFLFLRSSPSPTPQSGGTPLVTFPSDSGSPQVSQSKEAVRAVFEAAMAPYNSDNIKSNETVVAGEYALQAWTGDTFGGEALLKYNVAEQRWVIVKSSGGSWSVDSLVGAGVPQEVAAALFAGMHD